MRLTFRNEDPAYRRARDRLLESEIALRRQMEAVAEQLRALPPGGEVPQDYVFEHADPEGTGERVGMSELFRGADDLPLYVPAPFG